MTMIYTNHVSWVLRLNIIIMLLLNWLSKSLP